MSGQLPAGLLLDSLLDAARELSKFRGRADPHRALRALTRASQDVDGLTRVMVARARENGDSWARIGDSLGVSKQAAQQRFTSRQAVSALQADQLPLAD